MKKLALAAVVTATLGVGAGAGYLPTKLHSKETPHVACVAGPGEQCPTDEVVEYYRRMAAKRDEVLALQRKPAFQELQSKSWEYAGMYADFAKIIPSGYHWDDAKLKFIANPPVPAPQPAQPSK